MPFRSKKETCLAKNENKHKFIEMLSKRMHSNGNETKHASADANVLIAKTAVESSILQPTILLAEETDLLVLLLYYYSFGSKNLIFKPNQDKRTTKLTKKFYLMLLLVQIRIAICINLVIFISYIIFIFLIFS